MITAVILGLLLVVAGFFIRNLLNKLEQYEEAVDLFTLEQESTADYLLGISRTIQDGETIIESLDEKGWYRSDDEIGAFFEVLKTLKDAIGTYRLPPSYGEKEEE